MTAKEYEAMVVKLWERIDELSDKQLAQLRRSAKTGADSLRLVAEEQDKRGLLMADYSGSGYAPEIKKRIRDYDTPDKIDIKVELECLGGEDYFEGEVDKVIWKLQELKIKHSDLTRLEIYDNGWRNYGASFYVKGTRLETDAEVIKRVKKNRKMAEKAYAIKEKKRLKEIEQLKQLMAKHKDAI